MEITKEWLQEKSACGAGVKWFLSQKETKAIKVIEKLIAEEKYDWANWTICRVFDYKQRVQYAVYAAEQVIDIYEKKYPDNKKPREAIKAAKKCIKNPSTENKNAAAADAYAAYAASADAAADAADAAYAAFDAAYAAADAYAAYAAADAAAYAAAAYAAADAAAAYAAADAAAYAARNTMRKKILQYGLELLREGGGYV